MARLTKNSAGGSGGLFDVAAVSDLAGYDPNSATPPAQWPDFSAGIETEFCCPKCSYAWRGNPQPNEDDVATVTE